MPQSNDFQLETLVENPIIVVPKLTKKTKITLQIKRFFKIPVDIKHEIPLKKIRIGFCLVNLTQTIINLNMFNTFFPEILTEDNEIIHSEYSTFHRRTPRKSDVLKIMPRTSFSVFPDIQIVRIRDLYVNLAMASGDGGYWEIYELKLGTYKIRFVYRNSEKKLDKFTRNGYITLVQDLWTGELCTPYQEIKFCQ